MMNMIDNENMNIQGDHDDLYDEIVAYHETVSKENTTYGRCANCHTYIPITKEELLENLFNRTEIYCRDCSEDLDLPLFDDEDEEW